MLAIVLNMMLPCTIVAGSVREGETFLSRWFKRGTSDTRSWKLASWSRRKLRRIALGGVEDEISLKVLRTYWYPDRHSMLNN